MANDSVCDGCGQSFPLREGTQLCPKCVKLESCDRSSAEYKDIMTWLQCTKCGVTRRNMPTQDKPVVCAAEACQASNNTTDAIQLTPLQRSSASNVPDTFRDRTTLLRDRLRISHKDQTVTTSKLNTAMLTERDLRGGNTNEIKIFIGWQVRTSKRPGTVDLTYGGQVKQWKADEFITDVMSEILEAVNREWLKTHSLPLNMDDCSLRFCNNQNLEDNTSTLTVGQFYEHYSKSAQATMYFDPKRIPPTFRHLTHGGKRVLCLELFVNIDHWELRKDTLENENESTVSTMIHASARSVARKRARAPSSAAEQDGEDFRRRKSGLLAGVPPSTFRLSARAGPSVVYKQTAVKLKIIHCVFDATESDCKLVTERQPVSGFILDEPFKSGSMKHAYDLVFSTGERYVAKRFFKLCDEEDIFTLYDNKVSVGDNRVQIEGEIMRLSKCQWFMDVFYQLCHRKGVPVFQCTLAILSLVVPISHRLTDLSIADAFLAEEVEAHSVASGEAEGDPTDFTNGVTWLVEPKRSLALTKFSGTLQHGTSNHDLKSLTVYAWAHFVFGYSQESMVVADIQGTPAQVKGKDGLVLFDIMTHTTNGESGVGDFGVEGMLTFLKDHECRDVCHGLGLDKSMPIDVDEFKACLKKYEKEGVSVGSSAAPEDQDRDGAEADD
ncbi:hypothetical protein H0H93_002484 [Arthromyces matolae]|nr:hypothetical protein H0H93_002484 [Arthromyces matolae]